MKKFYFNVITFGLCCMMLFVSSESIYAQQLSPTHRGYQNTPNTPPITLQEKLILDGQPPKNVTPGGGNTPGNNERCSTDERIQEKMQDPVWRAAYEARKQVLANAYDPNNARIACDANNTVVIPLAFHFDNAYNTSNFQCLLDAVNAQVASLNDDFSGMNADLDQYCQLITNCGGTPTSSTGACITFCLADQNHPAVSGLQDGDPAITIGVYNSGGINVPGTATNGEWPGVLNVFIIDGLGFGVADGIPGNWNGDGVSQDGSFLGGPGFAPCSSGGFVNDDANWNLGRTLTHEIGHYLGLYHTFQGGCSDEPQSPYPVTDTPAQSGSSAGCIAPTNCGALATGCTAGESVQYNFMDYFDDACLVMFSEEQAIAMNTFSTTSLANGDIRTDATSCQVAPQTPAPVCVVELVPDFIPADGAVIDVCLDDGGSLQFNDASGGLPTTWNWTFTVTSGDIVLDMTSSTMQNPIISVTSGTSGTIDVTLQICDADGNCEQVTYAYTVNALSGADCPDECDYILDLLDSFGDGWDGATVDILVNGVADAGSPYTFATGGSASFTLTLTAGDAIDVVYTAGAFENEHTYTLTDPFGNVMFGDGPNPATGTVFSFTASCSLPTCTDGVQNGDETGVDCGGANCGTCCGNGVQDADETGVDCGGADCNPCPACPTGFTELINETFDGCAQPAGWTVSASDGGTTDISFGAAPTDVPGGGTINTDFAGCIVTIDDDANDAIGIGCVTSPVVDLSAYMNTSVTFDWQNNDFAGTGDFVVEVFDGTNWVQVFIEEEDAFGVNETINLDAYANPNFQIRFCYNDEGAFAWGAAFDNVSICGEPAGCPMSVTGSVDTGDFCTGTVINLSSSTSNSLVTYTWTASSGSAVIADPSAANTTATLTASGLCAPDMIEFSLEAVCTDSGDVLASGPVGSASVYPEPPADPADLINYVDVVDGMVCEPTVTPIAGCENTITVIPAATNPPFPATPGMNGTADFDLLFEHPGGSPDCCPDNSGGTQELIVDGSFEAGPGGGTWTEASTNFGTPICDVGGCGTGTGTGPSSGSFWAWFGGVGAFEAGSVSQSVTIPAGIVAADLTFELEMIVCDSNADFLEVILDDGNQTQAFFIDGGDAICGALGYTSISIDLIALGIGPGTYDVIFNSEIFGTNGNGTNFFVDDVSLIVEFPAGPDPCLITVNTTYDCQVLTCTDFTYTYTMNQGSGGLSPFGYNTMDITLVDGTAPYNYEWSTTGYVRNSILGSGEIRIIYDDQAQWSVTITDANGCVLVIDNYDGGTDDMLDITSSDITYATLAGLCQDGEVTIEVTGGTGSYTYDWEGPITWDGTGQGTNTISNLPIGWYSVAVGDGMEETIEWFWVQCGRGGTRGKLADAGIGAYPNPFGNETNIAFSTAVSGNVQVSVHAIDGQELVSLFNGKVEAGVENTIPFTAGPLSSGIYILKLVDAEGNVSFDKLVINK